MLREQKNNTCNGNCVLRAELKKQAENEQNHENTLKQKVESIYTITQIEYNFASIAFSETNKKVNFYHQTKPNSVSFAIFHPPTA